MFLATIAVILGFLALFYAGYFLTRRTLTALVDLRPSDAAAIPPNLPHTLHNGLTKHNIDLWARAGGGASIVLALLLMAIIPQWGLPIWLFCLALGYGISFLRFPR